MSHSGYYQWRAVEPPVPAWQPPAQLAFTRHTGRYGIRRLRAEWQAQGHRAGRYSLRGWLQASGQRALVLPGHLARYLLPAHGGLALGRPDAH